MRSRRGELHRARSHQVRQGTLLEVDQHIEAHYLTKADRVGNHLELLLRVDNYTCRAAQVVVHEHDYRFNSGELLAGERVQIRESLACQCLGSSALEI